MLLYLLRHADADTVAARDSERTLSEKGHKQAGEVARFCQKHGMQPSLVLTSPYPRARQTAEPVAKKAGAELIIAPWLASGMNPEAALEELAAYRSFPSVMLVGHEPDLGCLIAKLLGLPSTQVLVRKASLHLLELETLRPGMARLLFSLPCRLM